MLRKCWSELEDPSSQSLMMPIKIFPDIDYSSPWEIKGFRTMRKNQSFQTNLHTRRWNRTKSHNLHQKQKFSKQHTSGNGVYLKKVSIVVWICQNTPFYAAIKTIFQLIFRSTKYLCLLFQNGGLSYRYISAGEDTIIPLLTLWSSGRL